MGGREIKKCGGEGGIMFIPMFKEGKLIIITITTPKRNTHTHTSKARIVSSFLSLYYYYYLLLRFALLFKFCRKIYLTRKIWRRVTVFLSFCGWGRVVHKQVTTQEETATTTTIAEREQQHEAALVTSSSSFAFQL